MRNKSVMFYDKIYGVYVRVSFGIKYKDFKEVVKKVFNKDIEQGCGIESDGMTQAFITKDNKTCFWVWTENEDVGVLIHELTHVAFRVINERGVTFGASGEALCYYLAYLYNEFIDEY